jgi:glycosyltransferase involved in cell wall biosynthesis
VHENLHRPLAGAAPASDRARGTSARIPILFVIGTLDIGGAETQLVEMVRHLDRRFDPAVCCLTASGPLATRLEEAGIPVTTIGMRRLTGGDWRFLPPIVRLPFDLARFARCIRRQRPLIVHGVLLHAYLLGAFAGRLAGVPIVVAGRRSLSHFKRGRPFVRLVERLANRCTDLIVANSEAVRRDTIESERVSPDKVVVIHNGLDLDRYTRVSDEETAVLRRDLALGTGPVVIVIANLIAYKGHEYFLRAWAEVCRQWPDATALLVGDGPVRAAREADARALGIAENVRFLGTRTDVPALLAAADVLVHPSLEEGFCNALIEAMAAGKPVVATDVGGNAEAVVHAETGLIVPARDSHALAAAMVDVLQRPDRGAALGRAGRLRAVERFDRSRMVAQYETVYDDLLASRESHSHVRYQRAH